MLDREPLELRQAGHRAVAALLGLAAQLKQNPLAHTEVWFAFTSAEEVGCLGMHHLLDEYGHVLNNAYFIDFEMVGRQEIAYVKPKALKLTLA
ncbi:hypothetical protein DC030_15445, partial [Enterococcus faecalis]